ncbi:MAG: DUF3943 domain-containing protein [Bacteriovoracaceae bacterium]
MIKVFTLLLIFTITGRAYASLSPHDYPLLADLPKKEIIDLTSKKRVPQTLYTYIDREHTFKESLKLVSAIYGLSWVLYPLTQPKTFRNQGSFRNYKDNFGELVFDRDEPFWNWIIHPLSGSQLFLFYRANGYSRIESLAMTFISSTLFEFTIEIYTEPASIQDLYQTPVFGSIIGIGIETLSLYLLNQGNPFSKFFGHLINPATLFWFFEGKVNITPTWDGNDRVGLLLVGEF